MTDWKETPLPTKAHTETGRKIIRKICVNCKHMRYYCDGYCQEEICGKKDEFTNPYATCEEFEYL